MILFWCQKVAHFNVGSYGKILKVDFLKNRLDNFFSILAWGFLWRGLMIWEKDGFGLIALKVIFQGQKGQI